MLRKRRRRRISRTMLPRRQRTQSRPRNGPPLLPHCLSAQSGERHRQDKRTFRKHRPRTDGRRSAGSKPQGIVALPRQHDSRPRRSSSSGSCRRPVRLGNRGALPHIRRFQERQACHRNVSRGSARRAVCQSAECRRTLSERYRYRRRSGRSPNVVQKIGRSGQRQCHDKLCLRHVERPRHGTRPESGRRVVPSRSRQEFGSRHLQPRHYVRGRQRCGRRLQRSHAPLQAGSRTRIYRR